MFVVILALLIWFGNSHWPKRLEIRTSGNWTNIAYDALTTKIYVSVCL